MKEIGTKELQTTMHRGDVRLVMTMKDRHFQLAHIPGSEQFDDMDQAQTQIDTNEHVVVYCSDPACVASIYAYQQLEARGFSNVALYRGGLAEWTEAGLPIETGASA